MFMHFSSFFLLWLFFIDIVTGIAILKGDLYSIIIEISQYFRITSMTQRHISDMHKPTCPCVKEKLIDM